MPPIKPGTFESMIFLFRPSWDMFTLVSWRVLTFPRKTKISHPKNGHLSSPGGFCFEGPIGALKEQLRGVFNLPREDSRIEPEVMMIWFRWFSFSIKSILRSLGSIHLPGLFKAIFFVACSGRPTLENTSCMWRSIASFRPWAIFLKSVPGEKPKTQKIRKKPGFLAAIFFGCQEVNHMKQKKAVPKETAGKGTKKRETWRKKTVDLVRKQFFEGW